jgi:hypothetical protein
MSHKKHSAAAGEKNHTILAQSPLLGESSEMQQKLKKLNRKI